tara:strand:+ start:12058 stop:12846 length:789 start_codon:yes stop_codon:yes gene_type:complete
VGGGEREPDPDGYTLCVIGFPKQDKTGVRVAKQVSIGRAILVGFLWIHVPVWTCMLAPMVLLGVSGELGVTARLLAGVSDAWSLVLVVGFILCGIGLAWLVWSVQVPRWRVWAYRRVESLPALKEAAVDASLIWPEGHIFERTEIRSRAQTDELRRLERLSNGREISNRGAPRQTPSRLGTALEALLLGAIFTPLCVLAPAGLASMLGFDVVANPLFLAIVILFPVGVAGAIYARARRDDVSAREGFRRMLPAMLKGEGDDA